MVRGGQAMVEFAIVAFALMLLTVGAIDFGRAIWISNTLAHLAREGARYGVVPSRTVTDIQDYVYARAIIPDFNSTDCAGRTPACVTITRGVCGDPSQPVIVQLRGKFEPFTLMIAQVWGGGSYGMYAEARMFVEPGVAGVGACA
jgi:hypothetical protein